MQFCYPHPANMDLKVELALKLMPCLLLPPPSIRCDGRHLLSQRKDSSSNVSVVDIMCLQIKVYVALLGTFLECDRPTTFPKHIETPTMKFEVDKWHMKVC